MNKQERSNLRFTVQNNKGLKQILKYRRTISQAHENLYNIARVRTFQETGKYFWRGG